MPACLSTYLSTCLSYLPVYLFACLVVFSSIMAPASRAPKCSASLWTIHPARNYTAQGKKLLFKRARSNSSHRLAKQLYFSRLSRWQASGGTGHHAGEATGLTSALDQKKEVLKLRARAWACVCGVCVCVSVEAFEGISSNRKPTFWPNSEVL